MTLDIHVIGITGIPEIKPGMDLVSLLLMACKSQNYRIENSDIIVVTQKIISKTESQLIDLATVNPSPLAYKWAIKYSKDPRLVELALSESKRISRMDKGILLTETNHGFYCVNAGIDNSNIHGTDTVSLLPKNPDTSAERIRDGIKKTIGIDVAVIITDTWGRPWRTGLTNVAIGSAGINPLKDYNGMQDKYGRELTTSAIAVVDELAAAAELVMGKLSMVPVAIIKGYEYVPGTGNVKDILRESKDDLFR